MHERADAAVDVRIRLTADLALAIRADMRRSRRAPVHSHRGPIDFCVRPPKAVQDGAHEAGNKVRRLATIGSAFLALSAAGFLAAGVLAAPATVRDAPPGATARCNDGTYSFSQTRSGTCSHHGGVAQWLTPSAPPPATTAPPTTTTAVTTTVTAGTTTATPTTTTTPSTTTAAIQTTSTATNATPASGTPSIHLGTTVLLAHRTETSGCKLDPNPDRRCSPGAYSPGLTRSVICSPDFSTSTIRNVPASEKHTVELEYGMQPRGYGSTLEIDHIISLELGGSNTIANLFPEQAPGYHVKDKLENRLHKLVCSGAITLRAAQQGIAQNWEALYARVFGASPAVIH
jgi:Protein of unknown function (DUF3761)